MRRYIGCLSIFLLLNALAFSKADAQSSGQQPITDLPKIAVQQRPSHETDLKNAELPQQLDIPEQKSDELKTAFENAYNFGPPSSSKKFPLVKDLPGPTKTGEAIQIPRLGTKFKSDDEFGASEVPAELPEFDRNLAPHLFGKSGAKEKTGFPKGEADIIIRALPIENVPEEDDKSNEANRADNDWILPELPIGEAKSKSKFSQLRTAARDEASPDARIANSENVESNSIANQHGLLWWKKMVSSPLHPENRTEVTDTNSLIYAALKNSPRIQAISQEPLIRDLRIIESESEFDPELFVRSQFDDRNDPVGNTLTTGGAPFLEDNIWSAESGVRKKLWGGTEIEVGQRIGFQNSNSRFFEPQDQGTATLALNVSQPLMRGRGKFYNRSQVLIAQSAGGAAWETFQVELQNELRDVVRAYWGLYLRRSVFLQKRRNVARGEVVLKLLNARADYDAAPLQISRARAAVAARKADLKRAFMDIRNAETEIRRLVNNQDWKANAEIELLPAETPQPRIVQLSSEQVVETAIQHRNEIQESLRRSKIAGIEYNVGLNELLPELTLLLNSYVSDLEGGSGIGRALTGQFANTPGYSVGFEFEYPLQNRAARTRLAQRELQKAKIKAEVAQNIQTVIAEAQVADRELRTAIETLQSALMSVESAKQELVQNQKRWEAFALVEGDIADGQAPANALDQLLDSQDRLAQAELFYTRTEAEMKISEIELQRAMGTLLQTQNVVQEKVVESDRPELILDVGR